MASMNVMETGVTGHPYFDPETPTNQAVKGHKGSYVTPTTAGEESSDSGAWRGREWGSTLVPFSPGGAAVRLSKLVRTWDTIRDTAQSVAAPRKILEDVASGLEAIGGEGAPSFGGSLRETILQVKGGEGTSDLPRREAEAVEPSPAEGTGFFEAVSPVEPAAEAVAPSAETPATEPPVQPPHEG